MKQRILGAVEEFAPSLPNFLRYLKHVKRRRDFVYQDITRPLFEKMGSEGLVAIDVGANQGLFTRYLQNHFALTIAVEPLPPLAQKLRRIFSRNVAVEQCALGQENGEVVIRTPIDGHGNVLHALTTAFDGNDLKMFEHVSVLESRVTMKRMDTLNQSDKPVGFVKIDVEGFELEVLQGADTLLRKDRPIIMIEISKGHNPQYRDTLELLAQANYQSYVLRPDSLSIEVIDAIEKQPLSLSYSDASTTTPFFDFLFIPSESVSVLLGN